MTTETVDKRPRTIEEVSAYIRRRNWPKARSPIIWRKVNEHTLMSHCGRFVIDRHGDGDAARFTAKLRPMTVIGHRCLTQDQAKQICEAHASPLPLEPPKTESPPPPVEGVIEREPGCDDEL